jgi:lipopolysaccharide biosynthesis glycosyltransferase
MTTQTLDENTIVVVCAADDGYAMPLAVTIRSAIDNLGENRKIILFVIDGGIKARNKRKLLKSLKSEKCDIKWISRPDALLGDIQVLTDFTIEDIPIVGTVSATKHVSIATYYRLLISELLPKEVKKVIYLDTDLVIVKDLGQLWDLDMGAAYLLATHALLTPYVSSPGALVNYQKLGIPVDAKYFQPGVMVIDLEKWRTDGISAKCVQYLKEHRDCVRWHDSDVLNAMLACKWGELDPRWNQMPDIYRFSSWKESPLSEESFNQVLHDPYIIHFATPKKPWNSKRDLPSKDLWFKYVDMTAWSGWRWSRWRRGLKRLTGKIEKLRDKIAGLIRITD